MAVTSRSEGEPDSAESEEETVSAADSEPAFEFEDDIQRTIYVRDGSWQQVQDAINFETKRLLADHNLRDNDLFKREFHDALVRTAANHPEEIARYILHDRRIIAEEPTDSIE